MKSMKWVNKIIDVDIGNVTAETEVTPVKTLDTFTPQYLKDDNVESFCKIPQEQVTDRYEGCPEAASAITKKN